MKPITIGQQIISYMLFHWVILLLMVPVRAANIQVAQGNTALDQALNQVPIINIATPNQAGISHNFYHEFNVGKEGVILNNNTHLQVLTQLGGVIQNNPNLINLAAGVIINEVVSPNLSVMNGYLEVGGNAASVMVANPYGITCNGCGFINIPQGMLTTGKPQFDSKGQLLAQDIRSGSIMINGLGIESGQSDYFFLISRTMKINARVHAKNLKVIVGANRVNTDGSVISQTDIFNIPQMAIDSGALGGMYANRIKLISTEQGIAVNLINLTALAEDIELTTEGKITLKQAKANGNIQVTGETLYLAGDAVAQGNISLNSHDDTHLENARLIAGKKLRIKAEGQIISNASKLSAGESSIGNMDENGQISLCCKQLLVHQTEATASELKIRNQDNITQDNTRVSVTRKMKVRALQLNLEGKFFANNELALNGHILQSGQTAAKGSLRNSGINFSDERSFGGNSPSMIEQKMPHDSQLLSGDNLIFANDRLVHNNELMQSTDSDNSGTLLNKEVFSHAAGTVKNSEMEQKEALPLNARCFNDCGTLFGEGVPTIQLIKRLHNQQNETLLNIKRH